ncbi:MAG: hypothetical protein AB7P21_01640 [Lautropia sp.]
MQKYAFQRLVLVAALAAASSLAQAESRLSAAASGSITATAKLTVNVTVPKILYLRVGGAGTAVDAVNFVVGGSGLGALPMNDATFAGAVPIGPGTVGVTDTDASNGAGIVSAQLWSNTGTATLACASSAITSGTAALVKTDFKVTSTGTLAHPGGDLGCTGGATNVGTAGGAGAFSGTWSFAYSPSAMPAAGTYTGTVTYTATQP